MPPRPNASTDEILVNTIELIAEHDVSGVSVDMVAEKSGVSKATIYRRWPSREELIFEAMTYITYPQEVPDTGSIRQDLAALLGALVDFLNRKDGGTVFAAFLNAAIRNAKLAELRRDVYRKARQPYVDAIRAGIERGELREDVDVELVTQALIAPFVYRRIGSREKVPRAMAGQVVDLILGGCMARRG